MLEIGTLRLYQADQLYVVMFGKVGGKILGSLVGTSRGVVEEVFWVNVVGRSIFVDTCGSGMYILIGSREEMVQDGCLDVKLTVI
jgi:hypothetical protein